MRWRALLVALAVVTAGCSGFGPLLGSGDEGRPTLTPAPVPTVTETPTPAPGSRAARIARAQAALAEIPEKHRAAIENRSYTLYRSYVRETEANGSVSIVYRNETTWVESPNTYRSDVWVRAVTTPARSVWLYHNQPRFMGVVYARSAYTVDGRRYVRVQDDGTDISRPTVWQSADGYAAEVQRTLARYLAIDVTTAETIQRDGTEIRHVAGNGTAPASSRWEWYRTDIYVTEGGLVRRTVVKLGTDPGNVSATLRMRYENVGTTTVPRPEWLNRTTGDAGRRTPTEREGNLSRVVPATRGSGRR